MSETGSVKRVAKNSMFMYIRLIVLMFINFYTSRLLLSLLGIEDYGIYSVVGSISMSFVALKSLFSEVIQRYLNVAKGKINSINEQISIFNLSLLIHVLLVILFVFIVEIVGIWLLNNKLNIPPDRFDTALFVFQMSLLSMSIGILSIPYDALIIANEEMGFYAIISILDGILKLLFVIILPMIGGDYLRQYSIFLVMIPLSTFIIQLFYCRRYKECKYCIKFDKVLFRGIFSLSGWNFVGNICFSIIHEGINMILNIYGGVRINSSRAIAYQIKNVTLQVAANTMVAVRPVVMQQSVRKSLSEYFETIFTISRLSFFLNFLPIVPLFIYCPQILNVWLVEVPEYTVLFTRLILIGLVVRSLHEPINIMHMALGDIKRMLLIEGIIMVSFLFIIYVLLNLYSMIWIPFFLISIMEVFIIIGLVLNAKLEIGFPCFDYLKNVIGPMLILIILMIILGAIVYVAIPPSSILNVFFGIFCVLLAELMLVFLIMDKKEKNILNKLFKR